MISTLGKIVDDIDKAEDVPISFSNYKWLGEIPTKSGWYLIKTDASKKKLSESKSLHPEYKAHIDLYETINKTSKIEGIAITQLGNAPYVVYSGEATNLRTRASQHIKGNKNTFCLGLANHIDLHLDKWWFCFLTLDRYTRFSIGENKLLRLAVEQAWRAKNGWPILCKK